MTLVIEISPATEERLRQRAALEGRDEADVARRAVESYLSSDSGAPSARTVGERILADLERDGILGLWQDRPEDSSTLARDLRRVAEGRGPR